ncbi:MAG: Uma2 family endonuclease [Acaryochloridaceae cyanobacterium RL_2_7]|nr:Uma2 family endonuclease [Acaryochloridaceae cyanobacterium RL_2_7]
MSVTDAIWTIEDYHRLVQSGSLDNKAVELLQGHIIQMTPEGPLHSNCIRQTANALRKKISDFYEVSETHPITLIDSEPEPDIAIIQKGDYRDRHPNGDETALIIEFAYSSLDKDLNEKCLTYASVNIPEYWVVNLRDRHVVVLTNPQSGNYQNQTIVTSGSLTSSVCNISISSNILLGK